MMNQMYKSFLGLFVVVSIASQFGCEPPPASDGSGLAESAATLTPADQFDPSAPPEPANSPSVSDASDPQSETPNLNPNSRDPRTATDPANTGDRSTAPTDPVNTESMKVRPRTRVRVGGVLDLTFDDVEFAIEKDAEFDRAMLGPEIESLHGKEVIIRGFILESYQLKNIKEFVLVRDNQECCFGPGAFIYHNMQVDMVGDARAEYSIRPITLQGTFTIKPWIGPDGKCYSVYHIAATSFKK